MQGIANLVWAYAYADALVTPEVQRLFDSVAAQVEPHYAWTLLHLRQIVVEHTDIWCVRCGSLAALLASYDLA